jgi:outer membrane protein OmpA-like peptidoglycan-associated protein
MRKTSLTLLLSLFLFVAISNAQYDGSPNGLYFRGTFSNFQYPITSDWNGNDYTNGAELGYVRHLNNFLNLAVPLKLAKADLPINDDGDVKREKLIASLDLLGQIKLFKPDNIFYPYLLGGVGVMAEHPDDWKFNPEVPLGLGLNLRLAPHLYVSGETQYRLDFSDNRNQLQHSLGLWFILGGYEDKKPADSDKDGIVDEEDQCPNEPGTAALFGCPDTDGDGIANKLDDCPNEAGKVELKGCPDSDGDGIANHLDDCPNVPGVPEKKGCPDNDRDNDGVSNDKDKCPDVAGSPYANGCPDGDGDGVADGEDKCPAVAGLPKFNGCPDSDNDGTMDPEDRCPDTPGPASNKGCPELKQEEKEVLQFAMKAVQFETGSAKLLAVSNKILDEIAAIMNRYPEQKLRISGHTDSIGDAGENQKLSERRAKSCYDYLVNKGINGARMSHQGFGESKPIGDNRFADGREKNRRVAFDMYVD